MTIDIYENFKNIWRSKTTKQIEKEVSSWRKYMQKHSMAYAWHGKGLTPPNTLADGDKLSALLELLAERKS